MYRKKVMTTGLAILVIVTAISLITASGGSGFVTSAFAVKKSGGKSGTSTDSKSSPSTTKSNAGTTSTGTKRAFIKCVTAIAGSPTKAEVDHCWDQAFGGGSGLTLGGNFGGSGSSSTLGGGSTTSGRASSGPTGHASPSTSGSNT
jgi:hypothetical protein